MITHHDMNEEAEKRCFNKSPMREMCNGNFKFLAELEMLRKKYSQLI